MTTGIALVIAIVAQAVINLIFYHWLSGYIFYKSVTREEYWWLRENLAELEERIDKPEDFCNETK